MAARGASTAAAAGAESASAAGADSAAVAALFVQQNGLMHSLWSIYVVATFAAAGLAASAHTLPAGVAAAATIGFWLFALGHMTLLRQALAMAEATRLDLGSAASDAEANGAAALPLTLAAMRRIRNPLWIALTVHLAIDLCVTAILWLAVFHPVGRG